MQRCLGRAFLVTGVPLEKGMGEGDFVSGSPETGLRVLTNLELWRGRSQEAVHCVGHVPACRAPV